MCQFNGVYTQRFNRRHGLTGYLFQGRYKAILGQKDTYLLELTRYMVLSPVHTGMVEDTIVLFANRDPIYSLPSFARSLAHWRHFCMNNSAYPD